MEQGDKMADLLAPTASSSTHSKEERAARRQASVTGPRNTYIRAAERRGERVVDGDATAV